jgi:hypothetical protein
MSNQEVKYVPFTNTDELMFHLEVSQMLLATIKTNIELMESDESSNRHELEQSVITSLHVLMDGFATVILSIEQGYVK